MWANLTPSGEKKARAAEKHLCVVRRGTLLLCLILQPVLLQVIILLHKIELSSREFTSPVTADTFFLNMLSKYTRTSVTTQNKKTGICNFLSAAAEADTLIPPGTAV